MEYNSRNPKEQLKHVWKIFLYIFLNPFALTLLIVSGILIYLSSIQTVPYLISVFTIILSIVTGLIGGIYTKKWDDITQEKVIATRGKSANRSLQLLLSSTISLEKRTSVYLVRFLDLNQEGKITSEVIKTYFEEIIEECLSLEQEIVNSIQDWTDIIPEADIKTILNLITDLKLKYSNAQNEVERLNYLLLIEKEASAEQKQLLIKIDGYKKEVEKLRQQVIEQSTKYGVGAIGSSLLTGGSIVANPYLSSVSPSISPSVSPSISPSVSPWFSPSTSPSAPSDDDPTSK